MLNGSHSEIPLIRAAKALGFHVISTGNMPDLTGHTFADEYHCADFSIPEKILDLAKALNIDALCSCANDFGAITASFVAEKMGLPGHDSYEVSRLLHQKDNFKRFAQSHQISIPDFKWFHSLEAARRKANEIPYPAIVKPVDLTGGKGISRVNSKQEYLNAIQLAFELSRVKRIIVEEFVTGQLHSFSSFIIDQRVIFAFSDNEYAHYTPYLVSTSAAPAPHFEEAQSFLVNEVEKIARLLYLSDGIFHIQYINQNQFKRLGKEQIIPKIIDITRRCSGDFYPAPVSLSADLDWAQWIVKSEAGYDCKDFPQKKQRGFFGRHCIMSKRSGIVKAIDIHQDLQKNVVDYFTMWNKGEIIKNPLAHKLGVLTLRYQNEKEMLDKAERLHKLVDVELVG